MEAIKERVPVNNVLAMNILQSGEELIGIGFHFIHTLSILLPNSPQILNHP